MEGNVTRFNITCYAIQLAFRATRTITTDSTRARHSIMQRQPWYMGADSLNAYPIILQIILNGNTIFLCHCQEM